MDHGLLAGLGGFQVSFMHPQCLMMQYGGEMDVVGGLRNRRCRTSGGRSVLGALFGSLSDPCDYRSKALPLTCSLTSSGRIIPSKDWSSFWSVNERSAAACGRQKCTERKGCNHGWKIREEVINNVPESSVKRMIFLGRNPVWSLLQWIFSAQCFRVLQYQQSAPSDAGLSAEVFLMPPRISISWSSEIDISVGSIVSVSYHYVLYCMQYERSVYRSCSYRPCGNCMRRH